MHFLKSSWGLDVFIMYPDVLPLEIEKTWGLNQETTRTGRSQLFYGDKQTILSVYNLRQSNVAMVTIEDCPS